MGSHSEASMYAGTRAHTHRFLIHSMVHAEYSINISLMSSVYTRGKKKKKDFPTVIDLAGSPHRSPFKTF